MASIKPYIPGPIAPVDYFGPALSVVNSAAGSYLSYKNATKSPATSTVNNYYN